MNLHLERLPIKNLMLTAELQDGRIFHIAANERQCERAIVTIRSEVAFGGRSGESTLTVWPLLGFDFLTHDQMQARIASWSGILPELET